MVQKKYKIVFIVVLGGFVLGVLSWVYSKRVDYQLIETRSGWIKSQANPVLGGNLGTCFDVSTLKENGRYRMWFSWRPQRSIALVESEDGVNWSEPKIALAPNESSGWEDEVNRPVVIKRPDGYHMWYTGQTLQNSWIGYAKSSDGVNWERVSTKPVLKPEVAWEKVAMMCPHVLWDEKNRIYRIWYSAGEQFEPDAIGYATSKDGINWQKWPENPIFTPAAQNRWENAKVTGSCVVPDGDWFIMFYIGFKNSWHAQIGLARSKDGVTDWQRHRNNPIISPGRTWDKSAVYKPFAIYENDRWLLWYNGRAGGFEQIGMASHTGKDLGFKN